jgi:hypothetical protein
MLTEAERNLIQHRAEVEGFEYDVIYNSDYPEIKDRKFHVLLKAFRAAHKELAEYVGIEV